MENNNEPVQNMMEDMQKMIPVYHAFVVKRIDDLDELTKSPELTKSFSVFLKDSIGESFEITKEVEEVTLSSRFEMARQARENAQRAYVQENIQKFFNVHKRIEILEKALSEVIAVGIGHAPSAGYMEELIKKCQKAVSESNKLK